MRQRTAARTRPPQLLEKKAKVSDVDAHWEGNYDGLMEFWDDTSAETTAFALKLLMRADRSSGLVAEGRGVARRASRRRLLVLNQADRDGDRRAHRLPGAERRDLNEQLRRGSAGEWRQRRQAPLWRRRMRSRALEDHGSRRRRPAAAARSRSARPATASRTGQPRALVLGRQASLPAGQAGTEHHPRLFPAEQAAGQADRSHHL